MKSFYIFGTIFFIVYGQLIIKWQMAGTRPLPNNFSEKIIVLIQMSIEPWIPSAFLSAFMSSLCWMAAIIVFELSYSDPLMSLSFMFVLSEFFFYESITLPKLSGVSLNMTSIIAEAQR